MSQSRFVLKQIPVRGSGASDLTRYVSRSKLDPVREGRTARPLFTAQDDNLSVTQARRWLSVVGDKWHKDEALHYVLSFASTREYELLGDDEPARREAVRDFLRLSLPAGFAQLGGAEMRWAAGVHRNTDNPHLHLLLNRYAHHADTGQLIRLARLPAPLVAHHQRLADGGQVFDYGTIITHFAAHTDARHRERTRFLHYASPLRTVQFSRALLSPETLLTRPPKAAEILVGQWLLAELRAFHAPRPEPAATPASALITPASVAPPLSSGAHDLAALRTAIARLDQFARRTHQPSVAAYLSDADLRAVLVNPPAGALVQPLREAPVREPQSKLAEHQLTVERDLASRLLNRTDAPLAPQPGLPGSNPRLRSPIR